MLSLPPDGPTDGTILLSGGRVVMLQHIPNYLASSYAVHRFQLILYLLGGFILLNETILWQTFAEHKIAIEQLLHESSLLRSFLVANFYPAHIPISFQVSRILHASASAH